MCICSAPAPAPASAPAAAAVAAPAPAPAPALAPHLIGHIEVGPLSYEDLNHVVVAGGCCHVQTCPARIVCHLDTGLPAVHNQPHAAHLE